MTAFKMLATEEMHYVDSYAKIDTVLERVASVRQAVGREAGLAVDFHGRVHVFIQEQSLGIHYNQGNDLLDNLVDPAIFKFREGFIDLPNGPGLGIEVNEEKVREAARAGHDWKPPIWRNEDGTVAEW